MGVTITGITLFMMWLTEKATHASLTDRFKDAEIILNQHHAPASWQTKTPVFKAFMQGRLNSSLFAPKRRVVPPKTQLLARLDELILFFETCPFFDSEESRDVMLDELWQERDRWEALPVEKIYG